MVIPSVTVLYVALLFLASHENYIGRRNLGVTTNCALKDK